MKTIELTGTQLNSDPNMQKAAFKLMYNLYEPKGLRRFHCIYLESMQRIHFHVNPNEFSFTYIKSLFHQVTKLTGDIYNLKKEMISLFSNEKWVDDFISISCSIVIHAFATKLKNQIGGKKENSLISHTTFEHYLYIFSRAQKFIHVIQHKFRISKSNDPKIHSDEFTTFSQSIGEYLEHGKQEHAIANFKMCLDVFGTVKNTTKKEILIIIRNQSEELLSKVFNHIHERTISRTGKLVTSLCGDVFSVVSMLYESMERYLKSNLDILASALIIIWSQIRIEQVKYIEQLDHNFESYCTAANDFDHISTTAENSMIDILKTHTFLEQSLTCLKASSVQLITMFCIDAVHLAQNLYLFVFEPIEEKLEKHFFDVDWEQNLLDNEVALAVVRTIEDFLEDMEKHLEPNLFRKTLEPIISGTVFFYIRCILNKSKEVMTRQGKKFQNQETALKRMEGDQKVFYDFFLDLGTRHPIILKAVEREFKLLSNIQEFLKIASGLSPIDGSDFVFLLYKRIGNPILTEKLLRDLWILMNPENQTKLNTSVTQQLAYIESVNDTMKKQIPYSFKFQKMLEKHYSDDNGSANTHVKNRLGELRKRSKIPFTSRNGGFTEFIHGSRKFRVELKRKKDKMFHVKKRDKLNVFEI